MKLNRLKYIILAFCVLFASCDNSLSDDTDSQNSKPQQQTFTVVVESVGELFTGGEGVNPTKTARRPISSVTPTQTFDKLSVLIVEYQSPAKVVYKKTIDNWSNPDNKASIPWSTEDGLGRYATLTLTGNECLEEGKNYMAYVIGYQSGTYGGYEPFKGIEPGDYFNRTEVATVPEDGFAEEIFAGEVSDDIRNLYNYILKNQLRAIKDIKEGNSCKFIARNVENDFYLYNYTLMHALGHGVGLNVHELPILSHNSQSILKENMVVTNEPGIYLPGKYGIRIEDTIRVGKLESEVLTKSSKEILIVDAK